MVLEDKLDLLRSTTVSAETHAALEAEVARLRRELEHHQRTVVAYHHEAVARQTAEAKEAKP